MKTAVCLFVRDEERDIAEWVAYHSVLGFDAFLVFDNASVDETPAILRRLARHVDIRTVHWERTDPAAQRAAYEAALERHGGEFEWMLFIDSDEFFTPVISDSVAGFVGSAPLANGVGLSWAMFGSSGHVDFPPGLVIESFTWRAGPLFASSFHFKSLVRPAAVKQVVDAHYCEVEGGYSDASGRHIETHVRHMLEPAQFDACRINHYFTRSLAHWRRKIARGYRDYVRAEDEFAEFDRNKFEDLTATRFAPAVRERLAQWRSWEGGR